MTDDEIKRKPPSSLSVQPLVITQHNCQPAVGMNERHFREFIREEDLPIIEIGKLRGVEARVLIERMRQKAAKKAETPIQSNADRLRRLAGLRGAR